MDWSVSCWRSFVFISLNHKEWDFSLSLILFMIYSTIFLLQKLALVKYSFNSKFHQIAPLRLQIEQILQYYADYSNKMCDITWIWIKCFLFVFVHVNVLMFSDNEHLEYSVLVLSYCAYMCATQYSTFVLSICVCLSVTFLYLLYLFLSYCICVFVCLVAFYLLFEQLLFAMLGEWWVNVA